MSTNKFAIREAAITSFYDIAPDGSESLSVRLDTLKMTEIGHTSSTVYARGKQLPAIAVTLQNNDFLNCGKPLRATTTKLKSGKR